MENAKIQMEWDFLADFQTLCTLVVWYHHHFSPEQKCNTFLHLTTKLVLNVK